jgi:glycerol-3-phosphate acyltransferase PlsY
MNLWPEILLVLLAYSMGSIPFGYLFTKKLTGKNIFDLGSGNIGSTNVGRIAGKKIAVLTQVCDMSKGLLPEALTYFLNTENIFHFEKHFIFVVALSTILGHDFSIFLKLKGGKGVNTTLGASLLLAPFSVAVSVLLYFLVKWKYNFVSLASICLAFF